jgi:hypothetical protein
MNRPNSWREPARTDGAEAFFARFLLSLYPAFGPTYGFIAFAKQQRALFSTCLHDV